MRILVTGGSGFVGGHLARSLAARGNTPFLLLRQASTPPEGEGFQLLRHDGTTKGLQDLFREIRPDLVFHLASRFIAEHTPDDVEPLIRDNMLFGTQLLEAMHTSGATRLVHAGTSWQHYQNQENHPVCLYAAAKQAFEAVMRFYRESAGLQVIILKLFDTYGPRDRRGKLFSHLAHALSSDKPLLISPGEQLVDLVHVEDVVRAFLMAGERLFREDFPGWESYAVSSGDPRPLRQVVELYFTLAGKTPPIEWGGRPYRRREVMIPWNQGIPLPGWTPRISLEEGLARLLEERDV